MESPPYLAGHLRTRLPTSALLRVKFHAILAHEDVDKIHDFPRFAGTSIAVDREGSSTRKGDRKIFHDVPVVGTAGIVCDIVRDNAIEGVLLAGQAGNRQTQQGGN